MAWRLLCLLCLFAGGEAFLSGATGLGGTMRLHRFRGGGLASACGSGSGIAIEEAPKIELSDKTLHPMIGYGTYKVGFIPASASAATAGAQSAGGTEKTARECVKEALDVGYRFLDCAQFYGNENQVGLAIKDSGIPREDLFLASKVWTDKIFLGPHAVREQVDKTLLDLQTDYLDLYLIHWPVPGKHVDAYKELEKLKGEGKIRSIGMSNYAVEDYKELCSVCTVKPSINQIEMTAAVETILNPDSRSTASTRRVYRVKKTIDYFQKEGVVIQSYRALRDGKAFENPVIVELAQKYGKSSAQILGRWCVQKNVIYIPKSVKRERMIENGEVFSFTIEDEDMTKLDTLTTPEALQTFKDLYIKCVVRDTPLAGTEEAKAIIKTDITVE